MVKQKKVIHIIIEDVLELDDVDSMSVVSVDKKIELTSLDEFLQSIRELVIYALTQTFSFL